MLLPEHDRIRLLQQVTLDLFIEKSRHNPESFASCITIATLSAHYFKAHTFGFDVWALHCR